MKRQSAAPRQADFLMLRVWYIKALPLSLKLLTQVMEKILDGSFLASRVWWKSCEILSVEWMNECKSFADGQFSTAKVQNPRWSSIEIQNILCYWMLEIYPTDPYVAVFETRNQFNECQRVHLIAADDEAWEKCLRLWHLREAHYSVFRSGRSNT